MTSELTYSRSKAVVDAAQASMLLVRVRWRAVRGWRRKLLIVIGLSALFGVLFAASEAGALVRFIASQGDGSAADIFAANYIAAVRHNDLGVAGATTLGASLAASLFSPFTGVTNIALAAADDLTLLRPPRLHRYFDGIITHAVSTIGVLQLVALTAMSSLLTLDGGRALGLLLTWCAWGTMLLTSVAEGWAIEWLHRSVGGKVRRTLGGGLAFAVGLLVLVAPNHGRTVFGLGTVYTRLLNDAAHGHVGPVVVGLVSLASAAVMMSAAGLWLCSQALSRPTPALTRAREHRRPRTFSRSPNGALLRLLLSQMLRTGEVRRPLVTIVLLAVPTAWIAGSGTGPLTAMVVAIPLAVALAWGVNVFGVLGPGMTWLASQPGFVRRILWFATAVQFIATAGICLLCFGPPVLVGVIPSRQAASLVAGLVVSSALTTRNAMQKSVTRPYLAKLGVRGDVVVPPLTAINYTLRFVVFGGQLGVLTMTRSQPLLQVALVSAVMVWASVRYVFVVRRWADRDQQSRVIATVSST